MQKPLKIAVDIRDLRKAFSGTKTYLNALYTIWKDNKCSQYEFVFLDSSTSAYSGPDKWKKILEHLRFFYWKQFLLPHLVKKNNCSVLFCTDYFLPLIQKGFKTVVVFHDAFFFEYPQHYNRIWLQLFKRLAIPAAKKAAAIIVPSHYSKKRLLTFIHFNKQQLHVIYEAPSIMLSEKSKPINQPLIKQLQKCPYFLHVGTLNKNKNLVRLIEAFAIVEKQTDAPILLLLVGKGSSDSSLSDEAAIRFAIEKNKLQDKIILTGFLNDADLAHVYSNALSFVFPSFNEGFGIPVLEAFKFNIPLIAANNSSLPEIAGDAAIYFDPYDEKQIAYQMTTILNSPDLREELIEKGKQRLSEFSWPKIAYQITELFIQIENRL